jgi:hypothetical protein
VRLALLAVCGAAAQLGCSMSPLPLSAQAGSTVLVPIEYQQAEEGIGFGGTQLADPQRGQLVYSLCQGYPPQPGGFELVTRFTLVVEHDPRSANARDAVTSGRSQAISVVDIPATATPGHHPLCVVRRDAAGDHPVLLDESGIWGPILTLDILPEEVAAGSETIVGAPSPLEVFSWYPGGFVPKPESLPHLIPQPTIEIHFVDSTTGETLPLHAVDLLIAYPEAVITPSRAVPPTGLRNSSFWHTPLWPGAVRVQGAAGDPFDRLGLAFALDAPATEVLDIGDVAVVLLQAGGRNGESLTASAAVGLIR